MFESTAASRQDHVGRVTTFTARRRAVAASEYGRRCLAALCWLAALVAWLVVPGHAARAWPPGGASHRLLPALIGGGIRMAAASTSQKITFRKLSGKAYGTAPFTVSATASSGLPVRFASTTPTVCAVDGDTVTLVAVGKCTIRASQPGDATYAAAPDVDRTFSVAKGSQTITFAPLADEAFGTPPFAVEATATSSLPVSFASRTASVCTLGGDTVTILALGTCTLRASQAGNANWKAAANVDRSFTVAKGSQAIAFGALPDRVLGEPPFTVDATATSGLPVSFASLTVPVCTVAGTSVTLVAAGTCTVRASQAGSATYAAAPSVDRSFAVAANANLVTQYSYDGAGNLIGVRRAPAP